MKVNVPSELTVIVPTLGIVAGVPTVNGPVSPAIVIPVIVRFCLSASESFVTKFPETKLVSSVTFSVSSVAIGASFTSVIVTAKVPVSVPPLPSLMV